MKSDKPLSGVVVPVSSGAQAGLGVIDVECLYLIRTQYLIKFIDQLSICCFRAEIIACSKGSADSVISRISARCSNL